MDRREFLKYCSVLGASVALGKTSAHAGWLTRETRNGFPPTMLLIDAHAHPDQFYYMGSKEGPEWETWCSQYCDDSSTLDKMMKLGMRGSCFAAIGDTENRSLTFDEATSQIDRVIDLENQGLVRIVRSHIDLPLDLPLGVPAKKLIPGAILSLEGASPLGDESTALGNLDTLYGIGVRMITLMHYLDNQFGQAMRRERPKGGDGLSLLGRTVVERMMELRIIVDVAHAHFPTLEDIVEIALDLDTPIIDSHTSLSPCGGFCGGRLRTWEEMEMIADTGGLICTWPLKWVRDNGPARLTLEDWATENYELKERLGIEHIALGTDGGGVLPEMVEGYSSILDLPKLVIAMSRAGFKRSEIEAYMGGNLLRVIKQCIG